MPILPSSSAPTPKATSTKYGKLLLTGDLGNTAASPQVVSTHLSAALPINQGGTGSSSQNFVDLSTTQSSISGSKTFVGTTTISAGSSATSGISQRAVISPTITQTSTAGYTALTINPTESTTGSGAKSLIDMQVGSVSKLRVDNGGKINVPVGGAAAIAGTGTLSSGSATISTTAVTASSLIFVTDTASTLTNVGSLSANTIVAGTSFKVTSTNALDTSTFNWFIIN